MSTHDEDPGTPAPPHPPGPYGPPAYGPYGPMRTVFIDPAIVNPGVRLGARVIDLAFVYVLMFGLATLGSSLLESAGDQAGPPIALAVTALIVLGYETLPTALYGGTPGKLLVRIRVVGMDRSPVGFGRAFGRALAVWFFWFVPLLTLLDKLWLLWDRPYRQCLHDKAAGTVVVRRDVPAAR